MQSYCVSVRFAVTNLVQQSGSVQVTSKTEMHELHRISRTGFSVARFIRYSIDKFNSTPYNRIHIYLQELLPMNASICYDKEKNPLGGTTCCWNKYCKDTTYDNSHCGSCGNACGYGLSCCGGRCVDLNSNRNHCGSCAKQCPGNQRCSFGMCDYSGGYNINPHS
eukprot:Gb_24500 [translate_table: standard]